MEAPTIGMCLGHGPLVCHCGDGVLQHRHRGSSDTGE